MWEETGLVTSVISVPFACYEGKRKGGRGEGRGTMGGGRGGGLWQLELDYALHDFH